MTILKGGGGVKSVVVAPLDLANEVEENIIVVFKERRIFNEKRED